MTEDEFRSKTIEPPFDYMAEADKTCSVIFGTNHADKEGFVTVLTGIAGLCEDLNLYKKLLFRGKTPEQVGMPVPKLHESLAVEFDPNNTVTAEIDLLHGIVGVITEAGEMAEVLLHRIKTGEFDRVNAMEEVGDVLWYVARQLRGMNADFDIAQHMNIDKLHGRHGNAFDVFRDANRDLVGERAKLEAAAPLFDRDDGRCEGCDAMPGEPHHQMPPPAPEFGPCEGDKPHAPPEPGLTWRDGCWRREIVRDDTGLAV